MMFLAVVMVALAGVQADSRQLAIKKLVGFVPTTSIADMSSIDLDQAAIEKYLDKKTEESFAIARGVYKYGAFSRPYAVLSLQDPLPMDVKQGTKIQGSTLEGETVLGEAAKPIKKGAMQINFLYDTTDSDNGKAGCRVAANPEPVMTGCLGKAGLITFEGFEGSFYYAYDRKTDNRSERTLERMSENALYKMRDCNTCSYYAEFQKYLDYYGTPAYADRIIEAAFNGTSVEFKHGEWDFSGYDFTARGDTIRMATTNLIIGQYVVREMEDAFFKCMNRAPCDTAGCEAKDVHAMEGAVAFYAGSLEGEKGVGNGYLSYDLADQMCKHFKTCGENGDKTSGEAKVNIQIMKEFTSMQQSYLAHECTPGRNNRDRIIALMYVPLVQGTLRQAHIASARAGASLNEEAVGAAFASSIIPVVARCNQNDAKIIHDNMKPNKGHVVDFTAVKEAFERNYKCMRITCEDVGGLYWGIGQYYSGAGPCNPKKLTAGQIAGIAVGVFFAVLLASCCYCCCRPRRKAKAEPELSANADGEVA